MPAGTDMKERVAAFALSRYRQVGRRLVTSVTSHTDTKVVGMNVFSNSLGARKCPEPGLSVI